MTELICQVIEVNSNIQNPTLRKEIIMSIVKEKIGEEYREHVKEKMQENSTKENINRNNCASSDEEIERQVLSPGVSVRIKELNSQQKTPAKKTNLGTNETSTRQKRSTSKPRKGIIDSNNNSKVVQNKNTKKN